MKYSFKVLSALLLLALVFNAAGCSKLFGPSNDDILKAINDSGTLKSSDFTATSPITVVEKGEKRADGWIMAGESQIQPILHVYKKRSFYAARVGDNNYGLSFQV